MGKRVLVVDDDAHVREMVADYLKERDFTVDTAASGPEMDRVLARGKTDVVILDVVLRGEDGFELARRVRQKSSTPIIMLTAQGEEADRVAGLELGADDYVTKPFSPRELLARIRAVLRRQELAARDAGAASGADSTRYRFAGWELDTAARRLISPAGQRVELTAGEYALLGAFLRAPRRVLSRDHLVSTTRQQTDIFDRSIDVQVLRLRRKIEPDPNEPTIILTERSIGYFFDAEVEALR